MKMFEEKRLWVVLGMMVLFIATCVFVANDVTITVHSPIQIH